MGLRKSKTIWLIRGNMTLPRWLMLLWLPH